MKPVPFDYLRPRTLAEALAAKAEGGDDAMFLAGGQSLVPAMNFRLARPALLIDLNHIDALAFIRTDAASGELRIGARTRHRDLVFDPRIAAAQPLIAEAARFVAHPQIRNRGTLCGNLAHADPASEMPAVMLALDARLRLAARDGERWIAARDFFLGIYTTARRDDEMLVEVALPAPPERTGVCFLEVARRPGDFAMMGVAATVTLDGDGRCNAARIACCGAGETPIAADDAAGLLVGAPPGDAAIAAAAASVTRLVEPLGSVQASPDFQRHLAGVLTRRALRGAADRAANGLERAA